MEITNGTSMNTRIAEDLQGFGQMLVGNCESFGVIKICKCVNKVLRVHLIVFKLFASFPLELWKWQEEEARIGTPATKFTCHQIRIWLPNWKSPNNITAGHRLPIDRALATVPTSNSANNEQYGQKLSPGNWRMHGDGDQHLRLNAGSNWTGSNFGQAAKCVFTRTHNDYTIWRD